MSRKKHVTDDSIHNEWIATYSDTVTLLLTFFIMLYSVSAVNEQKVRQLAASFQNVLLGQAGDTLFDFNMKNGDVPLVGEETSGISTGNAANDVYKKVQEVVQKNKLESSVEIKRDPRGVIIELRDNVLFDSGSAEIKTNSVNILEKLNSVISSVPYNISVEGHTDNVPISNYKYESNWELSTARAVSVVKYFVETKNNTPVRFTAAGYGEYKPLVANDSDEHRAKNRRVNILIVASEKETGKK